jgi:ubiquinone/menaquinone biosynthesis C-methylase UbiE
MKIDDKSRSTFLAFLFKLLKVKLIAKLGSRLFNSYGQIWDMLAITEKGAMDAVYFGVTDKREFDLSGKKDADRLSKSVTINDVVLDIGCGLGRVEKYLAGGCREIHGLDVSKRMISRARKRLRWVGNVQFYKGNGRDLSAFPNGKFDLAFSLYLFQHLEKEDAVYYLFEAYRVLKPNGKLFFNVPNFLADEHFKTTFINKYVKIPSSRTAIKMRYYLPEEVKKIVRAIGFKVISLKISTDIEVLAMKPLKQWQG